MIINLKFKDNIEEHSELLKMFWLMFLQDVENDYAEILVILWIILYVYWLEMSWKDFKMYLTYAHASAINFKTSAIMIIFLQISCLVNYVSEPIFDIQNVDVFQLVNTL